MICEKSKSSKLPDIDKTKWVTLSFLNKLYPIRFWFDILTSTFYRYLVPNDLTAYHFNYIIRKRIKLPEKDSLYFFVNGRNLLKGGKTQIFQPLLIEYYLFLAQLNHNCRHFDGTSLWVKERSRRFPLHHIHWWDHFGRRLLRTMILNQNRWPFFETSCVEL